MRRVPLIRSLLDPVDGVPKAVEGRHWVLPLLVLCAAVTFSGVAFAWRLDASASVLKKMDQAGDLQKSSERELGEEIEQAQRIALVAGAARGVFAMPLALLFVAVALKIAAWLIGRKLVFGHAFTVAAVAFLPIALFHLLFGVVALEQPVVSAAMAKELLPSSLAAVVKAGPQVSSALGHVDFFNLWAVALVGLGFAAATKVGRGRSLALALVLYAMLSAVQLGLPGLMNQGGGPS